MELNIYEIIKVLKKGAITSIIAGIVFAAAVAGFYEFTKVETFTSSATVYVLYEKSGAGTESAAYDFSLTQSLLNDYTALLRSRTVCNEVAEKLGAEYEVNGTMIGEMISVSNVKDTKMIKISVTSPSPVLSQNIANLLTDAFGERVKDILKADLVSVVDPANLPSSPNPSSTVKSTIFAFFAGIILGYVATYIYLIINDRIETIEEVEKYIKTPVLAVVPSTDFFNKESREIL